MSRPVYSEAYVELSWPGSRERNCDEPFFNKIMSNGSHIVQQYMPDRTPINYNLRTRSHNKTLIPKTSDLNERNFIIRNLYKDCY